MPFECVVIGTSLGGLSALQIVLGNLPADFLIPIAIVQHRHKNSGNTLLGLLQKDSLLPIKEVEDKDKILPGQVYLAPPDYHLLIETGYFALSTDEPVSYARPSIDVLFESAADIYAEQAIGVILTGANHDGTQGLKKIKARGGMAIVQEPTTAESAIMPVAAISAVKVDGILSLSQIAQLLLKVCH
ncbi:MULTISPECIES: chemotaxis protein CheB [unclassified Nodularia (in: cyanobacteria)]|uniref:chemotaxis protein CheB n=1 Tax=unclassified Nodularia (in: cyanobacteria) TaxID=2656917 RepID=UPI00187F0964|nr:chemotaxis protein CheB [Nodularia sp. LEGE 06071]MBE9201962.1 chemotaxis protein CheB [Nodularia sp. LEGE 06071]MCC2693869.1 chemotaxis protein CheB [Nodularia sp. LEGE 04288]